MPVLCRPPTAAHAPALALSPALALVAAVALALCPSAAAQQPTQNVPDVLRPLVTGPSGNDSSMVWYHPPTPGNSETSISVVERCRNREYAPDRRMLTAEWEALWGIYGTPEAAQESFVRRTKDLKDAQRTGPGMVVRERRGSAGAGGEWVRREVVSLRGPVVVSVTVSHTADYPDPPKVEDFLARLDRVNLAQALALLPPEARRPRAPAEPQQPAAPAQPPAQPAQPPAPKPPAPKPTQPPAAPKTVPTQPAVPPAVPPPAPPMKSPPDAVTKSAADVLAGATGAPAATAPAAGAPTSSVAVEASSDADELPPGAVVAATAGAGTLLGFGSLLQLLLNRGRTGGGAAGGVIAGGKTAPPGPAQAPPAPVPPAPEAPADVPSQPAQPPAEASAQAAPATPPTHGTAGPDGRIFSAKDGNTWLTGDEFIFAERMRRQGKILTKHHGWVTPEELRKIKADAAAKPDSAAGKGALAEIRAASDAQRQGIVTAADRLALEGWIDRRAPDDRTAADMRTLIDRMTLKDGDGRTIGDADAIKGQLAQMLGRSNRPDLTYTERYAMREEAVENALAGRAKNQVDGLGVLADGLNTEWAVGELCSEHGLVSLSANEKAIIKGSRAASQLTGAAARYLKYEASGDGAAKALTKAAVQQGASYLLTKNPVMEVGDVVFKYGTKAVLGDDRSPGRLLEFTLDYAMDTAAGDLAAPGAPPQDWSDPAVRGPVRQALAGAIEKRLKAPNMPRAERFRLARMLETLKRRAE
jgi:outer membrane biosynthesis protein TonB